MAVSTIMFSLFTCVLGALLSSMYEANKDEKTKKSNRKILAIFCVAFLLGTLTSCIIEKNNEEKSKQADMQAFNARCKEYFEQGEYGKATDLIVEKGFDETSPNMLMAYLHAYGYGTEQDIGTSIYYYNRAKALGDDRAETNMVVSVVKNCYSEEKIKVLKNAYMNGNEMAIEYLDYVVNGWNSNPKNEGAEYTTEDIWELDDTQLLEVLNGEFFVWVCSEKTYSTSKSTSSTPIFTRKFLKMIGSNRVYEECVLQKNMAFPEWLKEDLW